MDLVRDILFGNLRMGDTAHTRSQSIKATVIVYAEAWGGGRAGRKRAREALQNPNYPNHSLTVLDDWGQKYPVEAGALGYARGNFDDYRKKDCRIVHVQRWAGFDDPDVRTLAGKTLERWARRGTRVRYDLRGAVTSTRLGRLLFPAWRDAADRFYCSEGATGLLVVCGILGFRLPYDIGIPELTAIMDAHRSELPRHPYPFALEQWLGARADVVDVAFERK